MKGCIVFSSNNNKGRIISIGIVGKFLTPTIMEVLLVGGLKCNFLSINELFNKGNNVAFDSFGCKVIKTKYDQNIFTSSRSGNTYIVNLNKIISNDVFLIINDNEYFLCYVI